MSNKKQILLWSILCLVAGVFCARGEWVWTTTNNYNDLDPRRDSVTNLAQNIKLTHYVTDGVRPRNFSGSQQVDMTVEYRVGGWTNDPIIASQTTTGGVIRWEIPEIPAGTYRFIGRDRRVGVTQRVFDAFVTFTNPPSAESFISNFIPITVTANVAGVSVVTTVLVDNVYSPSNSYYVTINQTNLTIVNITNQLDNITETITYNYSAGVHSVNSATGVVVIYDGFGNAMTNNGNNVYMVNRGTPTWLTFAPTVTVPVLDGKAYAFSATDAVVLAWSGVSTGYAGISKLDLYTVSNSFVSIASSNAPDGGDMTFTNASWHSIIYYSQTGTDTVRFIQK